MSDFTERDRKAVLDLIEYGLKHDDPQGGELVAHLLTSHDSLQAEVERLRTTYERVIGQNLNPMEPGEKLVSRATVHAASPEIWTEPMEGQMSLGDDNG